MAPHNNYRCKGADRWISIAVADDEEWLRFCQAVSHPEWDQDERFNDGLSRWYHQEELDKLITEWTINYTPSEITEILQNLDVAAMPVMNVEDQYFDTHFQEQQTFIEMQHPLVGLELLPGISWRLSKTPGNIDRVAPSLGEHNHYVFEKLLGMPKSQISKLTKEKVIW